MLDFLRIRLSIRSTIENKAQVGIVFRLGVQKIPRLKFFRFLRKQRCKPEVQVGSFGMEARLIQQSGRAKVVCSGFSANEP